MLDSTSSALAPDHVMDTVMVGVSTVGKNCVLMRISANAPNSSNITMRRLAAFL